MQVDAPREPRRRGRAHPAHAADVQRAAAPTLPLVAPPARDARQPLPLRLPTPPPPDQRGLKQPLLDGPRNFFHLAPPLPSIDERVRMIVEDIDWSAPAITIWIPGTSEYWIKQRFLDELHQVAPGAHVTMVPYEATWRFSSSVPDGAAVLRGVLDEVRRRAPGRPVLLAGESQGAWIISTVLADPGYASIVTRAAIWGHPAAAPQQFGRAGQVREVNAPGDIITVDLGDRSRDVMAAVEQLSSRRFVVGLTRIAAYAVQRPDMLVRLLKFWAFAIPGSGERNEHDYDDDIANGVAHLLGGMDARTRTAFTSYQGRHTAAVRG